jgi:hypothetical protein
MRLVKNALFLALFFCATAHIPAFTNKVLIIGIDGLMPTALAVARIPNLEELKADGCYSVRAVTHPVTHSAACWSSMFTGVWGDKHLVNDPGNSFAGNQFAKYPSFFKRLEGANSSLQTLCFARWSPLLTVVPDADVRLSFSSDTAITDETCNRLTNSNPDVLYTILLDVDSAGHSYGWGATVTNYVKEIEKADGRVGQMMAALKSRPTYSQENWLVIVLSDHGEHDHPDLERSRVTFHVVSGPSAARGVMWPSPSIVDVCATVLTHMGVAIDPAWNLDARIEGFPLPAVHYGSNLIFNGDAEATSGTSSYATNRGIAWWFDVADTTLGVYGGNPDFPAPAAPGPLERGTNLFLGGTKTGWISQRIDLSGVVIDADASRVSYQLSGWFGGAGAEEDSASLTVNFLDAAGMVLGTRRIGDVTAADRGSTTGLVERSAEGDLPPGSRFAEFVLTTTAAQLGKSVNDASADNLSFVLDLKMDAPFSILPQPSVQGHFSVMAPGLNGRIYTLERSLDLQMWTSTAESTGTGSPLILGDPNAPTEKAFYRVKSHQP